MDERYLYHVTITELCQESSSSIMLGGAPTGAERTREPLHLRPRLTHLCGQVGDELAAYLQLRLQFVQTTA